LEPPPGDELEHPDEWRVRPLGDLVDDRLGGRLGFGRESHLAERRHDARPDPQLIGNEPRPCGVAAQVGANPGHELVEANRLGEEVVGARVESLDHALARPGTGHQQDG
jgi:hypothetical protein